MAPFFDLPPQPAEPPTPTVRYRSILWHGPKDNERSTLGPQTVNYLANRF